jgi:hypothetical protein
MSTHQSGPYWITIDGGEYQEQALLDQGIEMRGGFPPFDALATDNRSNLDEHCDTTTVSLLSRENGRSKDEIFTSSTDAGNTVPRTSHDVAPAASSLHLEKLSRVLQGWPSSPKPINTPFYVKILNGALDALLLACSVVFLAFAIAVNMHDQHPTASYPRLTTTLLSATKYVISLYVFLEPCS